MAGINSVHAREPAEAPSTNTNTAPKQEVRLERLTPEYWRVTLDNPPFNLFGPETIPQLNSVITQIETDPKVKVVVFQSAVPGFFLTHYDFVPPLSATTDIPPGVTGLPAIPDMLVRLSRAPVVSIVSIRGRTTGVGGELSLASDMRFASREKAVISQWEIGGGLVPGGGPMARMPRLIGRGRALEMLLTGEDISGDLAERYGYVNRALPDAELDLFVDKMARRIAGFDKQVGADLTAGTWLWSDGSLEGLTKTISQGVATPKKHLGAMPPLGGSPLSPADLKAVSAYVWSIGHPQ